jgi:prepilin-type N-terminal cleavage/methylation domain-containing protein
MKSDFKTKLIQHMLNKKNGEKGFTLIELLVVIIIIGILAAIALPSFLNQAAKARQSEAKTYVGSINRSQQAYLLEKQQFSPNLLTLGLGIAATTANYAYGTYTGTGTTAHSASFGIASLNGSGVTPGTINTATGDTMTQPAGSSNKSYIGLVAKVTAITGGEPTALATVCEQQIVTTASALVAASVAGTYMTLSTNAAPVCVTGAEATHFSPIQ